MAATTRDSKIEKTDHRVLLTNIFFGGIITIGLNRFLFDFLLIEELKLYRFDVPVLIDFLFFILYNSILLGGISMGSFIMN